MDDLVDGEDSYRLSNSSRQSLHAKGFYTLNHFKSTGNDLDGYWLGEGFLRLHEIQGGVWSRYTFELNRLGIRLSQHKYIRFGNVITLIAQLILRWLMILSILKHFGYLNLGGLIGSGIGRPP